MFHDQLMKDEAELNRWHAVYRRLADAVDVSLGKFLEVGKEVQTATYETGQNFHAVTMMMIYEFAEAIDGASILVRVGASKNCALPLRTALEIGLGLHYILEDGATYEQRSLAYEYFHLHDGLRWAQKVDPEHPVGKQLRKELEGDPHADIFDVMTSGLDLKVEREKHEKRVNSPRYASVRAEIERVKEERKKAKKEGTPVKDDAGNWYSLWGGPRDLRALALRLKMLSSYEVLYRSWSNAAHGEGAMKRVGGRAADGLIEFEPLRSPAHLQQRSLHACFLTVGLTRRLVDEVVPLVRDDFRGWYVNDMKPAMSFINSVKING